MSKLIFNLEMAIQKHYLTKNGLKITIWQIHYLCDYTSPTINNAK